MLVPSLRRPAGSATPGQRQSGGVEVKFARLGRVLGRVGQFGGVDLGDLAAVRADLVYVGSFVEAVAGIARPGEDMAMSCSTRQAIVRCTVEMLVSGLVAVMVR